MEKRRCIIGQSGGPTVAINATLAGVIEKAFNSQFEKVYGMINGISGLLEEKIIELNIFNDKNNLEKLIHTPAMYLGSCRYKIAEKDISIRKRIFSILEKYNITDFFYIGGNDSMDTIKKLNQYAKEVKSSIHFIGIPKTIDNDLMGMDYTPGYPSACHYVATTLSEIVLDNSIYPLKSVTIVEIMGRDAGWLTASAQLVNEVYQDSIDLIYMPEIIFDEKECVQDVRKVLEKKDHVMVVVGEGIKDKFGMCVSVDSGIQIDAFGHMSNNGCAHYLKGLIGNELGCKVRTLQLGTLQRCALHLSSEVDLENAISIGRFAVKCALLNNSGVVVSITSRHTDFIMSYIDVDKVANHVKTFPLEWIDQDKKRIKKEFIDYVTPLIYKSRHIDLPNYCKINKF